MNADANVRVVLEVFAAIEQRDVDPDAVTRFLDEAAGRHPPSRPSGPPAPGR
jgi:hypothetical protein